MKILNKFTMTILLVASSFPSFAAASQNAGSRMISAAGAAIVFYGAITLYKLFKNKKK